MNTKLLKQKILDLAIRGKLTQQLKSDGTAADLLTQISDERRKTRDERKGTRSKKSGVILSEAQSAKSKDLGQIIPLDKSEAPFEIPANWEWVRLGDVCDDIFAGGDKPLVCTKEKTESNLIPVYANGIENDGLYGFTNVARVTRKAITISARGTIGFSCVRELPFVPIVRLLTVIPFYHLVDLKYLKAVFDILLNVGEGSSIPQLTVPTIRIFVFPLPPLEEQKRIVEKIQEAFAEIDSIENNKELLKTHIKQTRQKILDLAIHGKLVPQNKSDEPASVLLERITRDNPHYEKIEDEPFEIPENWAWAKLPNVCRAPITDGTHNSPPNTNEGEFFYITAKNIKDDGVDLSNVSYVSKEIHNSIVSRCCPEKGDVLLTKDGTIGNATVNNLNQPFSLLSSVALIKTHRKVLPWYIVFCLRSSYLQKSMKNDAKGTALKRVILSQINDFVIPLPPFNEQSRIVAKIEELFSTLDQMERNLV